MQPVSWAATHGDSAVLDEVVVTAERLNLIGTASTASEGVVVNDELTLQPASFGALSRRRRQGEVDRQRLCH
jgi:hypothetical protein